MSVIEKSRRGNVVLLYRDDSPKVFCRIKKPDDGGWWQRSTGVTDIGQALEIAEEWHDEMRFKAKHGLAIEPRAFSAVADIYVRELKEEVELGVRNERHLRDYVPITERYLKPFFGDRHIDTIKNRDIAEYQSWRRVYWISGPGAEQEFIEYERNGKRIRKPVTKRQQPSESALVSENVVLRSIFKTASKHEWIKEAQIPTIKTKIGKKKDEASTRRPAFTYEEYQKLSQLMREWVGFTGNWQRRDLLRWYFEILIHSGMRPGSETDGLRWCDVRKFKMKDMDTTGGLIDPIPSILTFEKWIEPTENGQTYNLEITVDGKTGRRTLVPTRQAAYAFFALKYAREETLGHEVDPEERVFSLRNGKFQSADSLRPLFKRFLEDAKLLRDEYGQARTLYSCRHTYATLRLLHKKVPVHTLAVNMGTSVAMIERHYSHLTARLAVDQLD